MREKALPPRERVALTLRAYRLLQKYCPGLMRAVVVKALLAALQPFATIWFSAQIISEIALHGDMRKVAVLAAAVVLINYTVAVVKGRVDALHTEREAQMFSYFSKIFADKQLSMDFIDIEDAAVQRRKTKEKENLFFFGNGLGQFVWSINGIIEGITGVSASLLMVFRLFTTSSGNAWMDSPLRIAAIAAVFALGIAVNAHIFKIDNAMWLKEFENASWFNRSFGFFTFKLSQETERAKDVRIYRQDVPADVSLTAEMGRSMRGKGNVVSSSREALATLVSGLNQVVCHLFVALKVFFGAFGVGGIVQYVGALGRLGAGLHKLVFGLTDNAVYTRHLKSLFEFLDMSNHKYQGTLPVEKRDDNEYEIAFNNVSFKYPGAEAYSLRNLNLKITIGKRLAIVGMNGSGKTTLIKLLCRLYDPTEGKITLNGIDIKKFRYDEYMDLFSVVFQDFKLFAFELGQNVAASADVDEDNAEQCLSMGGFSARLAALPNDLQTHLYKDFEADGVEISGGEAQKIALARALYKNAPFLVLDEPTAALDPIAECEVYAKFNEIVGDKTAIYISHRLSSCRFCDDIIVLHEGDLIQRGNHDALMTNVSGKYHELWYAQAQHYERSAGKGK